MPRNLTVLAIAGWLLTTQAWGQECAVSVESNDQIQFVQKELRVSAGCAEVTVTLKHIGQLAANIMGHNWVLAASTDWQALGAAGAAAGPPNYVPTDDRVIAATDVIGGGEEITISFDISGLEAGGDYTYFCSFPGHYLLMNGKFIIE